jgi:CheY-like chemotaxis protein
MSSAPPARAAAVLFVDDEPLMAQAFARIAGSERPAWDVVTATGTDEARRVLERRRFDAVVSDIVMPGSSGLALLEHVREQYPDVRRVVYSGVVEDYAQHQELRNADLVFTKPALASEILRALAELLR